LRILKWVKPSRNKFLFFFLIFLYFQEQRRLSKDEVIVTVPTVEIIRRMSQDDLPPVYESLSVNNNNGNTRSSDPDITMNILVFLYEII
jgi:hypothetical protein